MHFRRPDNVDLNSAHSSFSSCIFPTNVFLEASYSSHHTRRCTCSSSAKSLLCEGKFSSVNFTQENPFWNRRLYKKCLASLGIAQMVFRPYFTILTKWIPFWTRWLISKMCPNLSWQGFWSPTPPPKNKKNLTIKLFVKTWMEYHFQVEKWPSFRAISQVKSPFYVRASSHIRNSRNCHHNFELTIDIIWSDGVFIQSWCWRYGSEYYYIKVIDGIFFAAPPKSNIPS